MLWKKCALHWFQIRIRIVKKILIWIRNEQKSLSGSEKKDKTDPKQQLPYSVNKNKDKIEQNIVKGSVQRKLRPMLLYIILKLFSRRWTTKY